VPTTPDPVATAPRRPGRPRLQPQIRQGDPREQILEAAGRLFTTQGYAATGTREIAAAVGLEQPSLFHWFRRKEEILAELLDRTVAPALAASDLVRHDELDAEIGLFVLARRDVRGLLQGETNLASLQLLPEARGEAFARFWVRRDELRQGYYSLMTRLADQGRLGVVDPELATSLVFGLVESVITWFKRDGSICREEVAESIAYGAVKLAVTKPMSLRMLLAAAASARMLPAEG
jgi:AcrR family transcriptional regulator